MEVRAVFRLRRWIIHIFGRRSSHELIVKEVLSFSYLGDVESQTDEVLVVHSIVCLAWSKVFLECLDYMGAVELQSTPI